MSEAVQVALIVAAAPIAVQLLTHWLASRKIHEIHVLTNSTLTAANARIEALETKIKDMLRDVNE